VTVVVVIGCQLIVRKAATFSVIVVYALVTIERVRPCCSYESIGTWPYVVLFADLNIEKRAQASARGASRKHDCYCHNIHHIYADKVLTY
jgi:hypothetical protein